MNGHGGARENAGRIRVPLDWARIKYLKARKFSYEQIAARLGVSKSKISREVKLMKKAENGN